MGITLIAFLSAILLISDLGHRNLSSGVNAAPSGHKFQAAIVYFARDIGTDLCVQGLIDGLKKSAIEEGNNLEIKRVDAQGEMINIPAILQNYDESDVDLIMTISTPCLSGACNRVKHKPVVFTCVTDPLVAGAGKSRTDHLPFVTGVGSFPPVAHMVDFMQKLIPGLKAVGTLYNPAEANSVREMSVAREIFRQRGIRLEEVTVNASNEILQSVQILSGKGIDVVWVPGDNTAIQGYEGAVKAAADARLPLITEDCDSLARGGLACMGVGAYPAGLAAGTLAGRILRGARPGDLPFEEVAVEELSISRSNAAQLGIKIPDEFAHNLRP